MCATSPPGKVKKCPFTKTDEQYIHSHIFNFEIYILSRNVKPLRERMVHSLLRRITVATSKAWAAPSSPLLSHLTISLFHYFHFLNYFSHSLYTFTFSSRYYSSVFIQFIFKKKINLSLFFRGEAWRRGVTCVWIPQGLTDHHPCHCEVTPFFETSIMKLFFWTVWKF